jgi:hypothetical protein
MYIDKWWGHYVGGCDDSFLLLDYFGGKAVGELTLNRILQDLHLVELLTSDTLAAGDAYWIVVAPDHEPFPGVFEPHFDMPIDVVVDLSAIVVECLHNGSISIRELHKRTKYEQIISISTTKEDIALLKRGLDSFIQSPKEFDISEFLSEEELSEMLSACKEISAELLSAQSAQ